MLLLLHLKLQTEPGASERLDEWCQCGEGGSRGGRERGLTPAVLASLVGMSTPFSFLGLSFPILYKGLGFLRGPFSNDNVRVPDSDGISMGGAEGTAGAKAGRLD